MAASISYPILFVVIASSLDNTSFVIGRRVWRVSKVNRYTKSRTDGAGWRVSGGATRVASSSPEMGGQAREVAF